ncbi:MAG: SPOR domain-containing protein [Bacteroidales bacterium]|nr:SPOR domain-containing protein [Bacteroidales bacterium]
MKKKISFLTVLCCLFCCTLLQAQSRSANIIIELESNSSGSEGVIHIESDPAITALIGKPNSQTEILSADHDLIERTGYRLQIYMGNNPSRARSEASSRKASIENVFPELKTYLTYEAPNWKLVAGDFISREEATVFKQQLQKEFPQFGKEIYIVVDKIKIPVERGE